MIPPIPPAILRALCAVLIFIASASRGFCEPPTKDAKDETKLPVLTVPVRFWKSEHGVVAGGHPL